MIPSTDSICDIPGIRVGHAQNHSAKTGCTVVLPEQGAIAGIDIRGSAPGTREVEILKPVRIVQQIDALLLTGGSAFGLDAAGGVQQYLEEHKTGYDVGVTTVPIVPTAVIFDLMEGDAFTRPDKEMGYRAVADATSRFPGSGRAGAGTGATVGKLLGQEYSQKGGIGSASLNLGDIWLGALVVVNALGDVVDPESNQIVAGAIDPESGAFADSMTLLGSLPVQPFRNYTNTTLAVVATDAVLTKDEATKLAQMAQDGLSRSLRPAHTPFDGDVVFGLSVGKKQNKPGIMALGAFSADLIVTSILRAVRAANGL